MIKNLAEENKQSYEWIDITEPSHEELQKVAAEYNLHEESVQDSMQPDHLPKYERLKNYTFVILRIYSPEQDNEADTMQEVTNKIAVFLGEDFIITIHRSEWNMVDYINKEYVNNGECKHPAHVLNEIVKAALKSYEEPADKLTHSIEYFEEQIFLKNRKVPLLKGLYFVKRKIDVIRRVLQLSFDVIDHIDSPDTPNAYTRDIRDFYVKQQSIFDTLSENTNHLLNIYFNISSQKTNETIRILTIFSVFFLPLTFIVGIYGMNFKFMPELNWKLGYPGAYVLMILVTVSIYIWFKRKKWL